MEQNIGMKSPETETPEYIIRLDDPGADPINVTLEPSKITSFDSSAKNMSEANREKSLSATLKVNVEILPGIVIGVPSAEDTVYYQVLEKPQTKNVSATHENSIWVKKVSKAKADEAKKDRSFATVENLFLTPATRKKLKL